MRRYIEGAIVALDLGVRTGVAIGPAGEKPRSFAITLKKPGQSQAVAFSNLIAWLTIMLPGEKPALVVKEEMLALRAFRTLDSAEATVRLHAGLHAIVEGVCGRYGVRWAEEGAATIRKHFLGRGGKLGGREAAKRLVVSRCHQLGLLERKCRDDDQADALATHDWACAHLARIPPRELHLFGEGASP